MASSIEDYLSGGYLVTQLVDGAPINAWMQNAPKDLLPEKIISVGLCSAPNAPLFEWAGTSDKDYARFGIPAERRTELNIWSTELFDKEIGYPNIFFSLSTAREYVQRFTNGMDDIQIIGIGVHKENLYQIAELEQLHPRTIASTGAITAGFAGTGFAQALKRSERPITGEMLGFDVICCFYSIEHSWHCSGLAADALERFNFRPNGLGLIDDKANADKLANYANEQRIEGGVWLPVLVSRYPLVFSENQT
ncbi:MAG: hypothetical protein ABI947_22430 [Chloroflexota bacterium]